MRKLKITAILAAATCITAMSFSGCSNSTRMTISAKEIVDCETSGFSGNAVLSFDVDDSEEDKIETKYFEDIDLTKTEQYSQYVAMSSDLSSFLDSISYTIKSDKKTGFSNDDSVELEVEYDEELASKLGIAVTDTTFSYTVKGLTEGRIIDPFEGLKVEYTGIAPNVSVTFNTTDCDDYVRNNVNFSVKDNNGNLSNGEKFTVTVYYDESKAYDNAIELSDESKEYTVKDALEYPKTLDGVDLTAIDAQFKDMLEGNAISKYLVGSEIAVNGSWSNNFKVTKVEPKIILKSYLNLKNSSGYSSYNNEYDCIWDIKVTGTYTRDYDNHKEGEKATISAYYITYIQNIPVSADKTVPEEYLVNYKDELYSPGTKTYNEVYNEWITSNKAEYNITEMPVEE